MGIPQSVTTPRCSANQVRQKPYTYVRFTPMTMGSTMSYHCTQVPGSTHATEDAAKAACESNSECTGYTQETGTTSYILCQYHPSGGADLMPTSASPSYTTWALDPSSGGFPGGSQCQTIQACTNADCSNSGTLNATNPGDKINGCKCDCVGGWTGDTCDTAGTCTNTDCSNSGTLNAANPGDKINGCKCDCTGGWTGDLCDVMGTCTNSDCQNGATLNSAAPGNKVNGCKCDCKDGWTGDLCNTAGPCADSDCLNGAVLSATAPGNKVDGCKCSCTPGWTGDLCDVQVTQPPLPPLPPTPSSGSGSGSSSDLYESSENFQRSSSSISSNPGAPILIPSASGNVVGLPSAISSAASSNSTSGSIEDLGLYMPSASGPLPDTGSVVLAAVLMSSLCFMQRPRKG